MKIIMVLVSIFFTLNANLGFADDLNSVTVKGSAEVVDDSIVFIKGIATAKGFEIEEDKVERIKNTGINVTIPKDMDIESCNSGSYVLEPGGLVPVDYSQCDIFCAEPYVQPTLLSVSCED